MYLRNCYESRQKAMSFKNQASFTTFTNIHITCRVQLQHDIVFRNEIHFLSTQNIEQKQTPFQKNAAHQKLCPVIVYPDCLTTEAVAFE